MDKLQIYHTPKHSHSIQHLEASQKINVDLHLLLLLHQQQTVHGGYSEFLYDSLSHKPSTK